jgi:hypothetical protein
MTKKAIFVLLASFVLVLALVSVAYAAATSSYASWTSVGANAGSLTTPHKDYRVGTVKCAVCHAVHKAASAGELLLRSTASASCNYCHIANNLGLQQIYAGADTNYSNENADAHNAVTPGNTVGSRCVDCHSVHGANTMLASSVSSKILRTSASYLTPSPGTVTFQAEATAAIGTNMGQDAQVTVFCTICHPYYQNAHNGDIATTATKAGPATQAAGAYASHIMTTAAAAFNNSAGTYTGQVAWAESSYCRSCHDAGTTNYGSTGVNANSFPHYTGNYTRFMTSKITTPSTAADTTYTLTYPVSGQTDGVCLKCHVSGAAGVGLTY